MIKVNPPRARVNPAFPTVPELMAPASIEPEDEIVRASVTMPSVMELFGREMAPVTARFVVVALVEVTPVNRPVVAKRSVAVTLVRVTV